MKKITFRPITDKEYGEFKDWSIRDYAKNMFQEGQFATLDEAMKESTEDFEEGLPNGLKTAENYLVVVQNGEWKDIGLLWYETISKERGFVEEFIIFQQYRRQGYGMQVLHRLENVLVERDINRIVLHVFESNIAARKLYEKAGFVYIENVNDEPGSVYMTKELSC